MRSRITALTIAITILIPFVPIRAGATENYAQYGFSEVQSRQEDEGTYHLMKHTATGAQLVWLDDDASERSFVAGFRTPPEDSKGANHVLEHSLLCGSEKYPVHDLMHVLQNTSVADELNAYTSDDYTCYVIRTKNEADFYNLSDVYMSSILFPLVRTEENIFRQQGIRLEYKDGKAQYNGIVFSELKLRSLDTEENSIEFVNDMLWENLYSGGTPSLDAGGAIPDILGLTYEDVMRVYNTYYKPSNMLIYVSGRQDIAKTLRMLDGYLSQADKSAAPEITFKHTPVSHAQTVQEYNITGATKTIDIGIMAAGPDATDLKKSEAWGVLVDYLQKCMQEKFPDAEIYVTSGMGGGAYNMGLILSGIPVAQKDEAIEIFRSQLDETAQNGIPSDKLNEHLDSQMKAQQFGREEIFTGFAYAGDPFACVGRNAAIDSLRSDAETFKNLAAQWRDTPYQTIVVSGNGAVKPTAVPEPQLTDAELAQVKKDTEAFNKWIDTPDSEQALATLPQLSTDELIDTTFDKPQYSETTAEAAWYRTVDDEAEEPSFSLYFPIEPETKDLSAWCLLCEFLINQLEEAEIPGYCSVFSGASDTDPDTLAPRFVISGSPEFGKTGENVRDVLAFLKNLPLDDSQALRAFLEDRKRELKVNYVDPYPTEYDYNLRSLGQEQRFLTAAPTGFINSSVSYKAFIDAAADNPDGDSKLLEQMRELLGKALRRGNIIAGFTGSEKDYSGFRTSAAAFLAELPEGDGKTSCGFLPAGWPSALIISSGSLDSNHVMMSAQMHGEKDTATLSILGSVLSAKYLLPELRDKYGAYGATCRFDDGEMCFSCAGGVSVDDALAVYQNTGNWLRGLSLSEQELNGYRIGALKEYDERAEWERGNAASLAMSGRTQEDFDREREAILSVTLDDLKGCADLVDSLTSQGHVFAQVTKASEGNVRFPFAVRVNAESGRETVLLKNNIPVSDDATPLTRGETASLLADCLLAAGTVEQASETRFSDVAPKGKHVDAIALLYDRNILHGYGDGTFRPSQPLSRAEFCSIASVLLRDVTADAPPEFTDVPSTHWAHEVITNMAAQGILLGDGNGHFYPDRTVTRQEAETIINRLSAEQS